jgi:ribose-phosphate pyrophosphokinase
MNNKGIKVFSGNSNPDLARRIAINLGQPLAKCQVGKFSNGETSVMIGESVRDYDTYVIQSTTNPNVNGSVYYYYYH